jgi:hypothetical protein
MPGESKLMRSLSLRNIVLATLAASVCSAAVAAYGAESAPLGAWRTTNQCFLAIFVLTDGGHAQAAYLSGEREDNATWTWDGTTLTIMSPSFPLDRFAGHLTIDGIDADYTWHDLDRDQLNEQTCRFERTEPIRL